MSDPFAYLRRAGVFANVSKAQEAASKVTVRGHTRARPMTRSGAGALGSQTMNGATPKPNIEGNESAKYEKLEKRSLRSLKGGGSEKELREGHNTKQAIPKSAHAKAKIEKTLHEFKEGALHSTSKKGPLVKNRKQAVAIALSQARREK